MIILNLNTLPSLLSMAFIEFLSMYIFIIAFMLCVIVMISRHLSKKYYQKALLQRIKITDPYQIAYLQNGIKGYIRSVLFKLVQENYLNLPRKGWFGYKVNGKAGAPSLQCLNKAEQTIYHYAISKEYWYKVIHNKELHEDLWAVTHDLEEELTKFNLLYPQGLISRFNKLRVFFMFITLSLGACRYLWGVEKLKTNIWGLFLVGLLGTMLITHVGRIERVAKQGQKYLRSLKKNYHKLDATKSNKYKLVAASLLREGKKEMPAILKLLKQPKARQSTWIDLSGSYTQMSIENT